MDQVELLVEQNHDKHQKMEEEMKSVDEVALNEKSMIAF